ncbi:glycosyl transferase family 2 [Bacillus methanolicus PB1]|uniref:Glycosyl transferase family 2 n=1 Tax=Bacillus methanolicus PB1 TaxID=997296 RepID=I3E4C3_BACMT|nr:glycosyltransferase [Bacillus methanolicus]EIJ81344.1 glycosyl transferase family 2 [Bacillus methanolicus PB1]
MNIDTIKINWIGSQFAGHSFAIVNRNICNILQQDHQIDLRKGIPESEKILSRLSTEAERNKDEFSLFTKPDLTVDHQWPPDWSIRKEGRWVCMQPWEYGAIPRKWYIPMKYWVDEIWVNSSYTKECYVRSGIPENKIYVFPLGVSENVFNPNVDAMDLEPSAFRFLFVGGTIGRKGIDVLLQAYLNEFTADDDVCLFIKDTGTQSFYKGITLEKMILEAMSNPKNPRIVYLDKQFSEAELAGLYKACDCLVHPYRGEGFGLPIAEAMACGIPVIVPDKGSCRDFCSEETAFFVPSKEVALSEKKVGNLDTVDYPWWLSIDTNDLQKVMRFAFENQTLVKEKGQKASRQILSSLTWNKSAQQVFDRINQLVQKEPSPKLADEDIIELELEHAKELYKNNLIEEALETYLNILAIYPLSLMARYNTAIVYIMKKNYHKAIEHITYIANNMGEQSKDFQENIWHLLRFCYSKEGLAPSDNDNR